MLEPNHDPIPPSSAIDAVYALLAVIADPAAAEQRIDELDAKLDVLATRAEQLDARERNIADRESAADERELALEAREQLVVDIKELTASADRRAKFAAQAEANLTQKQSIDAAEFQRRDLEFSEKLATITARDERLKAAEADLATRIAAMARKEGTYADWLEKVKSGPGR